MCECVCVCGGVVRSTRNGQAIRERQAQQVQLNEMREQRAVDRLRELPIHNYKGLVVHSLSSPAPPALPLPSWLPSLVLPLAALARPASSRKVPGCYCK